MQAKIATSHEYLRELINPDNKLFYRFIKETFKAEDQYNMNHHFERYFSMSGFLRDLLNEIIKLQQNQQALGVASVSQQNRMLLRVLDIITYLVTGTLELRRAPKGAYLTEDGDERSTSFIFANLIDYKSFEFLSKLYKISEKLIDYDSHEMIIMNLWFRVVEERPQNFEILAKFLIHNMSSFVMKANTDCVEVEKQKRLSLSIFNYIKSRKQ